MKSGKNQLFQGIFFMRFVFACVVILFVPWMKSSQAEEETLKKIPWHLVQADWMVGKNDTEYVVETLSIDVTIDGDIPNTQNIFIAPLASDFNDTRFYAGFLSDIPEAYTRKDKKLRGIGRGLMYTRWGDRSEDALRPGLGGYYINSDHEGPHLSARTPYAWNKGSYTLQIVKMDSERKEKEQYCWAGVFVRAHKNDENVFVGALRFPGKELHLKGHISAFVEVAVKPIKVEDMPNFTVELSNLKINGEKIVPPQACVLYPFFVPGCAEATYKEGAFKITVDNKNRERTVEDHSVNYYEHKKDPKQTKKDDK
jgi:hypothetical protein